MNEIELEGKLNDLILTEKRRPDGSLRVQFGYDLCPSLTDQSQAHMSDLNFLIAKYKPDELASYIAARSSYRQEILGHDFSVEPSLQEAKNSILEIQRLMQKLPDEIQRQFRSPLDFLKFLDNPANHEKLVKAGIMELKQIDAIVAPGPKPAETPNSDPA